MSDPKSDWEKFQDIFQNPDDPKWFIYKDKIERGDFSDLPTKPENTSAWVSRNGEPYVPLCWYVNPGGVGELVHHNELYKCTRCEVLKDKDFKFKESIYPKYNGCYECTEDPFEVRKITPEEAGQNCCSICTTAGGMLISNAEAVWIDKCTQMGDKMLEDKYECTENCDCASKDGKCWSSLEKDERIMGEGVAEPCHECYAIPSPTGGKPYIYKKDLCKEGKDGKKISNHRCVNDECVCDQDYTKCPRFTTVISGPTTATPDDAGCWCGCALYEDNPDDPCGGTINKPDFNRFTCECECKLASKVVPCREGETFVASLCKCESDYDIDILNTNLIP